MEGGVKRGREEESPGATDRPPRSKTPSKKAAEAAESPFLSVAEQKRQLKAAQLSAKAERSSRLADVAVGKQFEGKEYSDLDPYLKNLDVCQPSIVDH